MSTRRADRARRTGLFALVGFENAVARTKLWKAVLIVYAVSVPLMWLTWSSQAPDRLWFYPHRLLFAATFFPLVAVPAATVFGLLWLIVGRRERAESELPASGDDEPTVTDEHASRQ